MFVPLNFPWNWVCFWTLFDQTFILLIFLDYCLKTGRKFNRICVFERLLSLTNDLRFGACLFWTICFERVVRCVLWSSPKTGFGLTFMWLTECYKWNPVFENCGMRALLLFFFLLRTGWMGCTWPLTYMICKIYDAILEILCFFFPSFFSFRQLLLNVFFFFVNDYKKTTFPSAE